MPLRWKTLLYSTSLLLGLVAAVVLFVNREAEQFVNEGIAVDLRQGNERIHAVEEERLASLQLTADLVASFPDLKALLATDVATIRDFLLNYQQQNGRSELLIVFDSSGRVVARTDNVRPVEIPGAAERWLRPAQEMGEADGVLVADSGVYHAAVAPARAGGINFGFVIAGGHVDDSFAARLRDFTESEVVILADRILGSTIPADKIPWRDQRQWQDSAADAAGLHAVKVGDENYVALSTPLGARGDRDPVAVILKSYDQAVEPYQRIRTGLLGLLLVASLAGIAGSALLARALTDPVAKLVEGTKQVAAGNLDFKLDIPRKDELGDLARSFNEMIAQRKRLEEQFRQAQKMEAVGRLAGGVAHDFNNLLTAINGYAQLGRSGLDAGHPVRGDLDEIMKASDRAAALTRQLLAFSRKQLMIPRVMDLNAVVRDMQNMLRRLIRPEVDLATILDENLGKVRADPSQMEQVIMNLVVNAGDAIPAGGSVSLQTGNVVVQGESSALAGLEAGSYVTLSVRDTGVGMGPHVLAHLFEPFFTTKEKGKGTGLGLATVYGIVHQSKGHVQVESEPGKGSVFTVYLRRLADTEELDEVARAKADPGSGSETILLVDDQQALRDLVRRMLEPRGYKVLDAASGKEALERSRDYGDVIHLMITDVVMPEMTGPQLAARMALERPATRVLFISGYMDMVDHGEVEVEASFLQKPFDAEALARRVREVLDTPAPGSGPPAVGDSV